eukprot:CAMPEP_0119336964 /NCGR_PEP_ID=MMETSP1333-20130426/92953_1 /TAXON_ID=418940 /ORGANISM="Scyphosphaera apsteinii, Strain RCC1455" /LENGTH=223 /DNA_ID=CAMNT_0007347901 /DNA_START=47 /DNA_END=718 /DNA_ORIENTATION=+
MARGVLMSFLSTGSATMNGVVRLRGGATEHDSEISSCRTATAPDKSAACSSVAQFSSAHHKCQDAISLRSAIAASGHAIGGDQEQVPLATMATSLRQAVSEEVDVLASMRESLIDRLSVMGSLADTLRERGEHEEAEVMQVELLAAMRKAFGAEHPSTMTAMTNLVETQLERGKSDEAFATSAEAASVARDSLGEEHPVTQRAMQMVGLVERLLHVQHSRFLW